MAAGFIGQLCGWWDFHLSDEAKEQILSATSQIEINGEVVRQEDSVNTLIIQLHFTLWNS